MIYATLFAVIFLLILLTFIWPPDSPWSPWWRTNRKAALAAGKLSKIEKEDIVYELGSGDGEFILTTAKKFKVKKAVGIEIEHTRYIYSKIRKQISKSKNVEFIRKDFKKVKLSEATVIYFYLVPSVIKRILPKLKRELKPGTRIVSYRYQVQLPLTAEDKKNKMYLYKI